MKGEKGFESWGCRRALQAKGTAQAKASRWRAECTASGPGGGAGSGAEGSLGSWRGGAGDKAAKAGEALIIYLKIITIT